MYFEKIAPSFFGISMAPMDCRKEYGYALLAIAGSDGDVSDPELEWLTIDCAKQVGIPEETVAEWEEFDYENADLEEIFAAFNTKSFANFNKLIIYDAIRMCSADGDYADDERDLVHRAAQLLRVGMDTVIAIEALVDMEGAADKLRMTIL